MSAGVRVGAKSQTHQSFQPWASLTKAAGRVLMPFHNHFILLKDFTCDRYTSQPTSARSLALSFSE
jgi:hypothetical protein